MFRMKYLDGSPVDQDYEEAVSRKVEQACYAEEEIHIDELEDYAEQKRKKESGEYE